MPRLPLGATLLVALSLTAGPAALASAAPTPWSGKVSVPHEEERGLRFNLPQVQTTADGARIRGSVCRSTALPFATARRVRIELLGSSNEVLASSTVRPSGSLAGRSPGCASYEARQDWRIAPSETVRVCLANKAGDRCLSDSEARS
jgi:hypothetical protein